jgi:two-component system LytT family response regulator
VTVRTLIVDDEPQARKALRIRLADHADFEVVGERASGSAAVDAIRELGPDLVFLDIQMPDLSGFEVLRRLGEEERPYTVFVTAYDEFALEAFRVNALAYLLKPYDDIRFNEILDRCRHFFRGSATGPDAGGLADRIRAVLDGDHREGHASRSGQGSGAQDRIVVKSGTRTRLVPVAGIDWIEAEGNYARLHCGGGTESHLVRRSLGELADSLDGRRFVRIHRSAIVNLDRVRELRTEDHRDFTVLLESGTSLRLSRTYRAALERALGDRI